MLSLDAGIYFAYNHAKIGMDFAKIKIMNDDVVSTFLNAIAALNHHIAEIYQFGSRCRDDWRPDSDYDILIVLTRKDREVIDTLYDVVMDVLLSTGRLISLKIFSLSEFNRLKAIPTPFMQNVLREGKKIGIRE
jgi:predicted nucleotidyltransferase